jgi:hypothetical protein
MHFAYGAELMVTQPPHITDWSQLERMKRIGLEPGKTFEIEKADPAVRAALESIPDDAIKAIQAKYGSIAQVVNGWQMNTTTMGVWGDDYLGLPETLEVSGRE